MLMEEKTFRSVKFKTFPEMLVLHARRFAFVDWVPRKLSMYNGFEMVGGGGFRLIIIFNLLQDIEIKFPDGPLQLDKYMSQGQQPGEELLPEEPKASGK